MGVFASAIQLLMLVVISPALLHANQTDGRRAPCPIAVLQNYYSYRFKIDDRSQRNLIARRLSRVRGLQPNLALDFISAVYKNVPLASEVLYQASTVLTHGQVEGGADWLKFLLVTKRATATDLGNMLHELTSVANILADLPPNQYVDLAGDSFRTDRGRSSTLAKPGFDLLIRDSSTRKLIRQVEVTSVSLPVRNGTDFREAVRHGVMKANATTPSNSDELDIYFDFDLLNSRFLETGKRISFESNGFVRVGFPRDAKGRPVRPDQLFHIGSEVIG
ncbi:MAG: hypothetical protein AAB425_05840, partial [Bdellovibrionota bacterium]